MDLKTEGNKQSIMSAFSGNFTNTTYLFSPNFWVLLFIDQKFLRTAQMYEWYYVLWVSR